MTGAEFKERFVEFLNHVVIDTKEYGRIRFGPALNGCQWMFIDEVADCLDSDIRHIVILKGRQQGISTICNALDLFWIMRHKGMQGAIITDSDDNRDYFRDNIKLMYETLPQRFKQPIERDNQYRMSFGGSCKGRFNYMVAGKRKNSGLGKAKAVNYLHATECAEYGDEEGLSSLSATLAETYENRLYIFESTAQGFNVFNDMWETAKRAYTQKALFIPWWKKEDYSISVHDPLYKVYGDDKLSRQEQEWVSQVRRMYGYALTTEQMAWWRYELAEKQNGDMDLMMQNYPPTEDHAFILSGSKFFGIGNLTEQYKRSKLYQPDYYKYHFGSHFYDTDIVPSYEHLAELTVYEEASEHGIYCLGADAAYSSNPNSDGNAIEVWRCYADRIVQAAEFQCVEMTTDQFAWVIAHLAGYYRGKHNTCFVNLEINGPGHAVLNELHSIAGQRSVVPAELINEEPELRNVIPNMSFFLYQRQDTLRGAAVLNWQTTPSTKPQLMHMFKSDFENGNIEIKSPYLLGEMRYVIQEGNQIQADGKKRDDRVMAAAIGHQHWRQWLISKLKRDRITFESEKLKEQRRAEEPDPKKTIYENTITRQVQEYLKKHRILVGDKV